MESEIIYEEFYEYYLTEKNHLELQPMPKDFYFLSNQLYIKTKKEIEKKNVARLLKDIKQRRLRKINKLAIDVSLMPNSIYKDNFIGHEKKLFEQLKEVIQSHL